MRGALPGAAVACSVLACSVLATGCGSTAAPGTTASAGQVATSGIPLAASVTAPGGTSWAVLDMGGSRAEHNNFWQLLARPGGASRWTLVTPPGVADNGGLVAAPLGRQGLTAGFNPSQDLTFSPLATTRDSGGHWAPALLPAGLAAVPSALAAGPGGQLLALTGRGRVQATGAGGAGGTTWTGLTSLAALARTPAGRSCGLTALTSVAFSPAGTPLVAGACARPGTAGIFSLTGGSWQAGGPALPAALAHRRVSILRLATARSRIVALLSATPAGAGTAGAAAGGASVLAAWAAAGGPWVLSAPLALGRAAVRSTAAGPGGTAGVVLGTGLGETVTPPDSSAPAAAARWHRLPALPAHSADLVLGRAAQVSALAPDRSVLVSWRLSGTTWVQEQTIKVPVPLGSSG